ncbi:Nitroreductase domain-containing protein [Cephalotus follicularis]|uniref:Nitroreductase domain-containing protein n=1 Tax=Cephalotus follicularis TaxID=3775 RepID=A0A1Q3CEK6_CEPFO|nr:Nitroreductase domain-containing protein [Cephalotus follicularis]
MTHFRSTLSRPLTTPNFHLRLLLLSTLKNKEVTHTTMSFSSSPSPSPSTTSTNPNKDNESLEKLTQALKYHNQTKHSFTKYARGPHGLDWANQPNPFRRYISAPILHLAHDNPVDSTPLYSSLFLSLPPPKPITKTSISHFFYNSLALSAWKSTGFSTWSLRVNPSSGNLHPTEAYLIAPRIESLSDSPFVAHYAAKDHSLELRATIESEFFAELFPENSFLIGISSIFWREAWKYGERAFRYCNHDVGHAIAAVSMAASGLGWDVKILDGLGYKDLEKLMGLEIYPEFETPEKPIKGKFPEIEFEHPDCVLLVFPNGVNEFDVNTQSLSLAINGFPNLEWKGKPNLLSKEHICWDIIYRTAEAVKKPLTVDNTFSIDPFNSSGVCGEGCYKGFTLGEVVRKRRSAVDMDGVTVMERDTFYQILLHCLPSGSTSREKQKRQMALPFRALDWDAEVHAALFVHRVNGLSKGLYFLVRNEDHFEELKRATRSDFKWEKPEGCPDNLPLYELAMGDCRQVAKQLSCHQDIAGDGCFSLGMVARLEPTLRDKGVWMYPRLFWETGVLGQVLYLEAHAVGISATGIGCFFDDPVHELLGLRGSDFQSLYHFTVGGPVLDRRIMSLPAYPGPDVDA